MMREIETRSLAPVLAVLMLFILSVPASAGDIEGFSSWAERRCGEIDRQWERASSDVMGTEGSLVTAAYNADDHSSLPEGARINGRTVPVQNRPLSGSANPIFHSSMETGGRFLWQDKQGARRALEGHALAQQPRGCKAGDHAKPQASLQTRREVFKIGRLRPERQIQTQPANGPEDLRIAKPENKGVVVDQRRYAREAKRKVDPLTDRSRG